MTLRFLTSGESHGRGLLVVTEGIPAGLAVSREFLELRLARRRRGFGRGGRALLERDELTVWGGLRNGRTTGGPVGVSIGNAEWESWDEAMNPWAVCVEAACMRAVTAPRPGHADLAGSVKFGHRDMRNVLERSSARTTAPRTVAGTLAARMLEELGVAVRGAVESIGGVTVRTPGTFEEWTRASLSELGVTRPEDEEALKKRILQAAEEGDSLGGTFVLSITGLPPGVGSFAEWDERLDGLLGQAILSIPGVKGVEFGEGFRSADLPGSRLHDPIVVDGGRWTRPSTNAGGLEGGMSNGGEIRLRAVMKPIPTMKKGLPSFDTVSDRPCAGHSERSDVCAVPSACVVAEAMAAWTVACAVTAQFGNDRMDDLKQRFASYTQRAERWNLHA